jgi:ABC-type multidrug transport system ATPase subunit
MEFFCDLKKAFDSVNHKILLSKLQFYGIGDKFHDLVASYSSDRYQRVMIASANLSYVGISRWNVVRQ